MCVLYDSLRLSLAGSRLVQLDIRPGHWGSFMELTVYPIATQLLLSMQ